MEVRCCFLGDTVDGHDWVSRLAFFVQSSGLLSTVFPVRFPVAIWSSLRSINFLSFSSRRLSLLSCCLTSTEARWPIRDGDRVGRGRESERLDRGNRPKKTGETVDRRQNNGSVKAVSPRHCPATCALRTCCFNCCAGQSP